MLRRAATGRCLQRFVSLCQFNNSKDRVVDDVHIVGIDTLRDECLALQVFNLFDSLYLGEDEVSVRTDAHRAPCLIIVVILTFHQLQRLVGILVVKRHGLLVGDVHYIGKAFVQLDKSYDAVVDERDELRTDAFAHHALLLDLERTDPLCLDKKLVGECCGTQDAPRGLVVVEFLLEEGAALGHRLLKLGVRKIQTSHGLFFLLLMDVTYLGTKGLALCAQRVALHAGPGEHCQLLCSRSEGGLVFLHLRRLVVKVVLDGLQQAVGDGQLFLSFLQFNVLIELQGLLAGVDGIGIHLAQRVDGGECCLVVACPKLFFSLLQQLLSLLLSVVLAGNSQDQKEYRRHRVRNALQCHHSVRGLYKNLCKGRHNFRNSQRIFPFSLTFIVINLVFRYILPNFAPTKTNNCMKLYSDEELADLLDQEIFHQISEAADRLGLECYVVGGYVRDIFLERPSNDIDVVVVGSGISVAQELKRMLGRKAHLSVFKNFGTAQVKFSKSEVEFVGARRESYSHDSRKPIVEDGTLEDDQNRRDFTINAMAICLNKDRFGELVDPFNGLADLEDGIIATPLEPDITFSDDPLRMMRCIRFATQLNFQIEDETFVALERMADRIKIVSGERIKDELNKIIMAPHPSIGFEYLQRCGLLQIILPELSALDIVDQKNGRAHKNNFYHTLEVLENVVKSEAPLWLRWAALLHDVGKTKSKRWDPAIGWTFHNHNLIGAKMVPQIFRRLMLPMDMKMKYVQKLVELHMRPIAIADDEVTDSAVRRLLNDAGEDIEDLMMLCEADITSKNEVRKKLFLENFRMVREKLTDLKEKDYVRLLQPVIDGNEIMEMFHLKPSREVGILKQYLKDAVLDNRVENEREPLMALLMQKAKEMKLD